MSDETFAAGEPISRDAAEETLQIRYDNSLDDIVAASRLHDKVAAQGQRVSVFTVAAGLGLAVALIAARSHFEPYVDGFIIGAVAWAIVVRTSSLGAVRRVWSSGENSAIVCWHELEIVGSNLVERTPCSVSSQSLDSLENIVSVGDYTLIYLSAATMLLAPRSKTISGDYEAFFAALRQAWAKARLDISRPM